MYCLYAQGSKSSSHTALLNIAHTTVLQALNRNLSIVLLRYFNHAHQIIFKMQLFVFNHITMFNQTLSKTQIIVTFTSSVKTFLSFNIKKKNVHNASFGHKCQSCCIVFEQLILHIGKPIPTKIVSQHSNALFLQLESDFKLLVLFYSFLNHAILHYLCMDIKGFYSEKNFSIFCELVHFSQILKQNTKTVFKLLNL